VWPENSRKKTKGEPNGHEAFAGDQSGARDGKNDPVVGLEAVAPVHERALVEVGRDRLETLGGRERPLRTL
jgi:hypothetical protein